MNSAQENLDFDAVNQVMIDFENNNRSQTIYKKMFSDLTGLMAILADGKHFLIYVPI